MTDLTEAKCQMDVMRAEIRDLRAERDGLREDIRQILDWHNCMGGPHKIREIAERALAGGKETSHENLTD